MSSAPEIYYCSQTSYVPNSKLPVLLYRDALPKPYSEETSVRFLEKNEWLHGGTWGAVPRHHFHPNTHESYAVFQGSSTLLLGVGPLDDPDQGQEAVMRAGDVIILPAGVSHCSKDFQDDYRYIGVYPKVEIKTPGIVACAHVLQGSPKWKNEYCRDEDRMQELRKEAEDVLVPEWDPVRGHGGPLCQLWAH